VIPIIIAGEMIMGKKSNKKKNKKEKRKLRKSAIKCAICGRRMKYKISTEPRMSGTYQQGSMIESEYFECSNKKCRNKAPIDREPKVKKGRKNRVKQNKQQPLNIPKSENIDNDNLVYEMIYDKLQDKDYDIGNGGKYNPIIRKLNLKGNITDVSDKEHNKYTTKILKDLSIID